jgi:3-methyladenine DNA glycosylase AlkD
MTDFTNTLKELRRKLRTRENGPASEAMEKLGIKYNRNHGLAVREIKEIANNYKYNHELALELHFKDIRELVLMSFMIENPETVECSQIEQWLIELKDTEQAEQIAINLITEATNCYSKLNQWANIDNNFAIRAVFISVARIAMTKKDEFNNSFFEEFIELCVKKSEKEYVNIAKAISFALRRIGRINNYLRQQSLNAIEIINNFNYKNSQIIYEEVSFELNDEYIVKTIKN